MKSRVLLIACLFLLNVAIISADNESGPEHTHVTFDWGTRVGPAPTPIYLHSAVTGCPTIGFYGAGIYLQWTICTHGVPHQGR